MSHVQRRSRGFDRRDFLSLVAGGAMTMGLPARLALAAPVLRQQQKRCVVLWMAGGPSHLETLDPKEAVAGAVGSASIATAVPGIHLSENLPELAKVMDEVAIVRSLTSREGSHPRAQHLMQHGYLPMGGVKFPALGANVCDQLQAAAGALPGYVRIGGGRVYNGGAGMLGVEYAPLGVRDPSRPPDNTTAMVSGDRREQRLALLDLIQANFGAAEGADRVAERRQLVNAAEAMIQSPGMEAFDLAQESSAARQAYGEGRFAEGCLLARRLLEAGVTFVEVVQNGWDSHQDNHKQVAAQCAQVDRPASQLLRDLRERGMLDSTLVVWLGEFGRTPKINARGGRDHYPKAFSAWLAGCGVRGGQVIGATDEQGAQVIEQPVSPKDLHQTIYAALGIDADYENTSSTGRPIRLVDEGTPIEGLLG
ncbi:DUF1501 domain-containing protein [Botrimarina hoheduenensis]|uniref:DUF1501 domain-containing protein n=1 Tax=Botrimarina hoheduenensis TaxID=2528000 RepID=A0A5C5VW70_9BACT|nr:DUF1501 domain-containing protein [Botrimarina hoheduenensis]TWT42774.1 hypothetical protein Pla111_27480 [Botrimarina hoheduenensis]